MGIEAICVPCGRPKKGPFVRCPACGFLPETEYQKGRALIFARTRIIGGTPIGRDAPTLKTLSAQIRAGRFYEFDPGEERRAVEAWHALRKERESGRARRRRIAIVLLALMIAALAMVGAYLSTGWIGS